MPGRNHHPGRRLGKRPDVAGRRDEDSGRESEPIPGRELAEKVLASGYQTKSKDFLKVIWVGVGKMDNVENVPGKGYRLKKGKHPNEVQC